MGESIRTNRIIGKNNRYVHPNKEVLNNLKDSKRIYFKDTINYEFDFKNNICYFLNRGGDMIKSLNNNDTISIKMFGKEKDVVVFCTGDNQFDENGNYKEDNFQLNSKELEVLNWFIENVKIDDYRKEIVDYCNEEYSNWQYADGTQEGPIGIDDVEKEIDIKAIAINVTDNWKSNNGFVYPEISFFGECKCDEENGICIGFRDKKFLGIHSQDWTL